MKKENTVSTVAETKSVGYKLPEMIDLLQAGAHFGHKKSAWNPRMKKFIYEERNGIHIIDLVKTLEQLDIALNELSKFSSRGNILIVGTKGQAATIVQNVATDKGLFYINNRWPGGLFTNFDEIKKSVNSLIKMEEQLASGAKGLVKKEVLLMQKDVDRLNKVYNGIKFMDKLPEAVIVIDSKVEKNAIKEARTAGVPIIALIDTNCDPDIIDYPIPANDDSLKSISLFVGLFGDVVGKSKFALSTISLRRDHKAMLDRLSRDYAEEKERQARMENEDRERMKSLRDGKVSTSSMSSVVRVVKKEKDINAEIEAAEKVMKEAESRLIEDLGLSARIIKSLNEAGIHTIGELKHFPSEELVTVKGIGVKAADDIVNSLKKN